MTAIFVLVLILVVSGVGFAGYKFYSEYRVQKPKPASTPSDTSNSSNTSNAPATSTDPNAKTKINVNVFCVELNSKRPCSAKFELQNLAANPGNGSYGPVYMVDESGVLSAEIEPGKYNLVPDSKTGYPFFIQSVPNPIEVKAGQTVTVNIDFYDGTR